MYYFNFTKPTKSCFQNRFLISKHKTEYCISNKHLIKRIDNGKKFNHYEILHCYLYNHNDFLYVMKISCVKKAC